MARTGLLAWLDEECALLEQKRGRDLTLEETDAVAAGLIAEAFGEEDRFITLQEVDFFFKQLCNDLEIAWEFPDKSTHHFTLEEISLMRKYH